MGWMDLAALFVLVICPLFTGLYYLRLKQRRDETDKLRMYGVIIATMWAGTAAVALVLPADEWFRFHETFPIPVFVHVVVWVMLAYVLLTSLVPLLLMMNRHELFLDRMREQVALKLHVFPVTVRERRWFAAVAISVGIGEELVYRSFLVRYMEQFPVQWSLLTSFAVAAIWFGLVHFNQGAGGMINAAILGICFGYLFVLTGNLLLPIILHTLYDLRIAAITRYVHKGRTNSSHAETAG